MCSRAGRSDRGGGGPTIERSQRSHRRGGSRSDADPGIPDPASRLSRLARQDHRAGRGGAAGAAVQHRGRDHPPGSARGRSGLRPVRAAAALARRGSADPCRRVAADPRAAPRARRGGRRLPALRAHGCAHAALPVEPRAHGRSRAQPAAAVGSGSDRLAHRRAGGPTPQGDPGVLRLARGHLPGDAQAGHASHRAPGSRYRSPAAR